MRLTRRFALPNYGFALKCSRIPRFLLRSPHIEISGDEAVFSVNNRKHHNAAYQEVRPPKLPRPDKL